MCHQSNRTQKLMQTKKFDRNPSPHVKAQDALADDFLGPQRKTMVIYLWGGRGCGGHRAQKDGLGEV